MKPARFAYHSPESVEEAVELLVEYGEDAKLLAGGQSLIPLLAMRLTRFENLIDLGRVLGLRGIESVDDGLRIGAMTTQASIERDPTLATLAPLVTKATRLIGHFQIRNRGTIGGSIAHADPAAEYPAVALALDAEMQLAGPAGTRCIPAAEFFVATWTTAAAADEVLVDVRVPAQPPRTGTTVEEFARRHGDFAVAGVACSVTLDDDDTVQRAAIALFGMGSTPMRATGAESALAGAAVTDSDLEEIGHLAITDLEPPTDLHATAEDRFRIAAHLARRALGRAIEEART